jgi:transcription elongation GreA/GreB family factor
MPIAPSKAALQEELERVLATDLARREGAHHAAMEAATHEEAKPENDKDTRALEQSYLARGEARRVEELRAGLAAVRAMRPRTAPGDGPAALGALVTVEEEALVLWLAPHGGGVRLDGGRVHVVTPQSPLGRAVLGKRVGDECEVTMAGRTRTLTIRALE